MRVELELRNLPRFRLMEYLVAAGGSPDGDGAVTGGGWWAWLEEMEAAQVGAMGIPRDRLVIEGEEAAVEAVQSFMRSKTMRGGG